MAAARSSLSTKAAPFRMLCRRGQSCFFSKKPDVLPSSFPTSVWWDLNYCKIPKGCDPSSIVNNVTRALLKLERIGPIRFPITFSAYADKDRIKPKVEQALSETGIKLTHVPYSRDKHAVGTKMLYDLLKWTKAYPPPGNCLFIFQDTEFGHVFELMHKGGYEMVLANPDALDDGMKRVTHTVWYSHSLLAGRTEEL